MLTVTIHKDVTEYKPKVIGGLSMRTLVCLGAAIGFAVAFGLLCTLVLKIDVDSVMYIVWIAAAPPALLGFYQPHGLPFEKFAALWAAHNARPQLLLYRSAAHRAEMAAIARRERDAARAAALDDSPACFKKLASRRGAEIWSPGGVLPGIGAAPMESDN